MLTDDISNLKQHLQHADPPNHGGEEEEGEEGEDGHGEEHEGSPGGGHLHHGPRKRAVGGFGSSAAR